MEIGGLHMNGILGSGEPLAIFKNWLTLGGAWGAPSVEGPTSAQVTISRFVGSSPASGSVLMARGLEPASDSVSPSL